MSDIAKLANVSKSAVSLAINGKDGISQETRDKILRIIDENGYEPLRKSRKESKKDANLDEITLLVITDTGILNDDYQSLPFFNSLILSLSQCAGEAGWSLRNMVTNIDHLDDSLDQISHLTNRGTLVLGTDLDAEAAKRINQRLKHVVFLDTFLPEINANFVTMDSYQGAYLAAEYMISRGYQRIGYFASDKINANFSQRRSGFRDGLLAHGVKIRNEDFFYTSPTETNATIFDPAVVQHDNLPDAIFCENDYIAIWVVKIAQIGGVKLPEQLGIMGFDGIYEGTLVTPELTTIKVPIAQIAKQALRLLKAQNDEPESNPEKVLVATQLLRRESL